MGKMRVEGYVPVEAQETSDVVTEVPKKEKQLKRLSVSKTVTSGDTIRYTGDDSSDLVTKEYFHDGAGIPHRCKSVDVSKIKEPQGEGRDKTYVEFANGLKYLEYIVANRGYKKI